LDRELLSKQMEACFVLRCVKRGKNPRKIEGSAKALPMALDLAGLSWSGHGVDEYQPSHRWIYAGPCW
jgi:hypothetical protein